MSKKLDRLYIRVDAMFHRDERYLAMPYALRDSAYCLFELLNGWSRDKQTDGRVPATAAISTGLSMEHPRAKVARMIEALVAVGLLLRDGDDLVAVKYEKWQDTREEIERASAAGRAGGKASGAARRGETSNGTGPDDERFVHESSTAAPTNRSTERERFVHESSSSREADDSSSQTETEIPGSPSGNPPLGAKAPSGGIRPPLTNEPADPAVEKVCERMLACSASWMKRPPSVTVVWRHDARLLLHRDERPLDEVLELIEWLEGNSFWRRNVQGVPKLREQYDRLLEEMRSERRPNGAGISARQANTESYSDYLRSQAAALRAREINA